MTPLCKHWIPAQKFTDYGNLATKTKMTENHMSLRFIALGEVDCIAQCLLKRGRIWVAWKIVSKKLQPGKYPVRNKTKVLVLYNFSRRLRAYVSLYRYRHDKTPKHIKTTHCHQLSANTLQERSGIKCKKTCSFGNQENHTDSWSFVSPKSRPSWMNELVRTGARVRKQRQSRCSRWEGWDRGSLGN